MFQLKSHHPPTPKPQFRNPSEIGRLVVVFCFKIVTWRHVENGPLEFTAVLSSDFPLHDVGNTVAASISKG